LLAVLGVLFACRYGWRKAVLLGGFTVPILLALYGGRMTDISDANAGTGQTRLQLWRDGMVIFKEQPFFGVGMNEYGNYNSQVAHNSYLHSFSELGVVGGGIFIGLFYCAFFGLRQIQQAYVIDPDMRRMQPYMLAMVAAYAVGILSLSRCYEVPTYTMLGLVATYLAMVPIYPPGVKLQFSGVLVQRIIWCSLIFLICTDLVVRFFAN
jgi:O-antigen ligase